RPTAPLFPYTTLFRSLVRADDAGRAALAPADAVEAVADAAIFIAQAAALAVEGHAGNALGAVADRRHDESAGEILRTASACQQRSEEHTSELQSRENL